MPALEPHPPLSFDESGAPLSSLYGDVFRSRAGAGDEALAVFVDGCGLRERWMEAAPAFPAVFTVLELGFGLGVNFLSTLRAWRECTARGGAAARGMRLHYVSVEAHPLTADDLGRGLTALDLWDKEDDSHGAYTAAQRLVDDWPLPLPGMHLIEFGDDTASLTLAFGDAAQKVPSLHLAADAIYLDGFAPSRNPQMWAAPLMKALARLSRPGTRLATYSSAQPVRQALQEAGFELKVLPGHGGKRRRLVAVYAPRWRTFAAPAAAQTWPTREAVVVGAGLAGAAVAAGLARHGWRVTVLERAARAGSGGSAQPLLAEHPHLSPDDNLLARLSRFALLRRHAERRGQAGEPSRRPRHGHGVPAEGRLELHADAAEEATRDAMLARLGFPAEFVRAVSREEASDLAGRALPRGGLWFACAGIAEPAALIAGWLGTAPALIDLRCGSAVAELQRSGERWRLLNPEGKLLAEAPLVVLANAGDAARLGQL
ncbi:MAG: tRNA (5-methylaminomethyl-2-thiouridine)(34)-methyltransferase MnmD, partial [Burkholderiales bacterium]|nr:tRNA (5-methylaminomethyl-2-thiouridine)(34)-methyltransferase MnmD [Burkholderiales bacterium]